MRTPFWALVLASYAGMASAQQSPPPAAADSLRLTREGAVAQALAHNPQLEVSREQVAEARAGRVQMAAFPDVSVTASLDQEPGLLHLGQAGARNVGLGLQIPFPDKFRLLNHIGTAGIRAAEYADAQVRQQIAAQTAEQYDSLLVAIRHRGDLMEARALSEQFVQKTQARFTAGTAAKLDVIRAQVDLAQADNQLIANERTIANARAGLNRFLGRPLGAPIVPVDSLAVPPLLPALDRVEGYALSHRPELGNLQSQIAGAKATTTLSRQFWIPDFTLGATHDYSQPAPTMYSAGVAFPLPLFFWQHTRGEIAQNVYRERELAAATTDMRAQVSQDVRNAYASASTALRQAIYIRDQLLPSAREVLRSTMASYSLGGSSALEVIDARRTLLDAESQYSDALAAASTARWDLQRAAGAPLDLLGPGVAP